MTTNEMRAFSAAMGILEQTIIPPLEDHMERPPQPQTYDLDSEHNEVYAASGGGYVTVEDYDKLRIAFDESLARLREIQQLCAEVVE